MSKKLTKLLLFNVSNMVAGLANNQANMFQNTPTSL